MTVDEVAANGDRRAAAEAEFFASGGRMSIKEVAAATGLGERQAGTVRRQWKGRLAANGGGPASGVSPPRLPAPRAIADAQRSGTARQSRTSGPTRDGIGGVRGKRIRRGKAPWYLVAVVVAAIGIVATVTFTISYGHISDLAADSGLANHAGMYPLGIDGLVIACTGFLMVDKLNGRRGPWLARLGVVLGLAGTIAGNVLAVPRNPVAMVGAGIMPAALAVVVHLGFRFLGREP